MPKVQLKKGAFNFLAAQAVAGTFTDVSSLVIDEHGRITSITTSSFSLIPTLGSVLSFSGVSTQLSTNTTTGYITVGYPISTSTSGIQPGISSISIDNYGRATSISSAAIVSSGTYFYPQSMTVDSMGRVVGITTGSSNTAFVSTLTLSYNFPTTFSGITKTQQIIETINTSNYVATYWSTLSTTIYVVDCTTSTIFYISPTTDFSIEFKNLSYTNMGYNVIVNNTGGYSFKDVSAIYYTTGFSFTDSIGGLMRTWNSNDTQAGQQVVSWLGSGDGTTRNSNGMPTVIYGPPRGVAGHIEVYHLYYTNGPQAMSVNGRWFCSLSSYF